MTNDDAEPRGIMSRTVGKVRCLTSGGRSCTFRPSKEAAKDAKRRKKSTKAECKAGKKDEEKKSIIDQS